MNERIKLLAEQATEYDYTTWDSYNQKELVYYKFNQEKFAELIVKECILSIYRSDISDKKQERLVEELVYKFGFGVEE